jgi:uncharacterized membrane protein YbaN (DUF454 family)
MILCMTFVLSKLWFLAAIFPATNQMLARATSAVGMFKSWREKFAVTDHQSQGVIVGEFSTT